MVARVAEDGASAKPKCPADWLCRRNMPSYGWLPKGCGNKTGIFLRKSRNHLIALYRIFVHLNHTNWNGQADAYIFGNSPNC